MRADIEIKRDHLRYLLQSVDKINSIPEEDVHADVHLKADSGVIQIYSYVPPTYVKHQLRDSKNISVDIEEPGNISFNIETLTDIVQKSSDGSFHISFSDEGYHITTPESSSVSSIEFDLPRHTDSLTRPPEEVGELYSLHSVPRIELNSCLGTMSAIAEYINIFVEDDEFAISIQDKVTGSGKLQEFGCTPDIQSMSMYYLLRPLRVFTNTIIAANDITILVSDKENICLRATIGGWMAEIHLSYKNIPHIDTYINL